MEDVISGLCMGLNDVNRSYGYCAQVLTCIDSVGVWSGGKNVSKTVIALRFAIRYVILYLIGYYGLV